MGRCLAGDCSQERKTHLKLYLIAIAIAIAVPRRYPYNSAALSVEPGSCSVRCYVVAVASCWLREPRAEVSKKKKWK